MYLGVGGSQLCGDVGTGSLLVPPGDGVPSCRDLGSMASGVRLRGLTGFSGSGSSKKTTSILILLRGSLVSFSVTRPDDMII